MIINMINKSLNKLAVKFEKCTIFFTSNSCKYGSVIKKLKHIANML